MVDGFYSMTGNFFIAFHFTFINSLPKAFVIDNAIGWFEKLSA